MRVFVMTHVHLPRANREWATSYPTPDEARVYANSIRLLNMRQLSKLFPGCQIYRERFAALTKSLVAYGGWPQG